jgi:hypothetical protein
MDGKTVVNEYCVCNIKVAAGDPERVEWNGRRFHRGCFRGKVTPMVQQEAYAAQQQTFAFVN